jgi:Mg2+-importing ATPase
MLKKPLDELYKALGSSAQGLTSDAAKRQLGLRKEAAKQTLASKITREIVALCSNPLVLILLGAAGVAAFLGERIDAFIIVFIVVVSTALNAVQTYRSGKAVESLRAMVAPTATAMRDAAWKEIPQHDVVPGDVIRLSAGDMIPADCRLIESVHLSVQQAALTGESMPAQKAAEPGALETVSPSDCGACLFLGTSVLSGSATALVVNTGEQTVFGDIAAHLAQRAPETEFERGLKHFGTLIMKTVVFLVLFVFLTSIVMKRDSLQSLLFAISLAVGLTPEFLPMITTITLGQGAIHMAKKKVIVKNLISIQNFGSMDVFCSDKTGTLTTGEMTLAAWVDAAGTTNNEVLGLAKINSKCETGIRSSLDDAILAGKEMETPACDKLGEIPFDFDRRLVSVLVRQDQGALLVAKGAPESIFERCLVTPAELEKAKQTYAAMSEQGQRVLAVATKSMPAHEGYSVDDEKGLELKGFLAFADPPLPDAAQILERLKQAGVTVKVISGDSDLVTRHVCDQVGLKASTVIVGADIDKLSDSALGHVVEVNDLFARISPAQKNRIIIALKKRGHVVGYMGDGINDAPSLHAADVGISVSSAVDVARDAADIILLERGLDVLYEGILEGRKAFGNVMKYLLMGTSSNFGNMFSMAGASMFLKFLPMLPTQILLNNFLYDLSQVTIPTDRVDESYIRKPKKWDIKLIRKFMIAIGPISSVYDFLTFYVLLKVLHAKENEFHSGWFVESLATQVLVIFVIRTAGNPFKSKPSVALSTTTLIIVAIGVLLPYSPVAATLGLVPLPLMFYAFLIPATATYLGLVQFAKSRILQPAD